MNISKNVKNLITLKINLEKELNHLKEENTNKDKVINESK